jgi:hypothetical protein
MTPIHAIFQKVQQSKFIAWKMENFTQDKSNESGFCPDFLVK